MKKWIFMFDTLISSKFSQVWKNLEKSGKTIVDLIRLSVQLFFDYIISDLAQHKINIFSMVRIFHNFSQPLHTSILALVTL